MAIRLLLLFIFLPLVETWLLIEVGSRIGALATIALICATAIAGSALVRRQGLRTLQQIQACQRRGEAPAQPLLEGAVLLLAGVLLVLPGFITDSLGFLALIPPLRRRFARQVLRRIVVVGPPPTGPDRRHTIEGDYRRDD